MARAQIALIIPLGDAPGHIPGLRPDQGLPGGGYYPDQGLPGGGGGGERPSPPIYHPGHPDHGLPAYPDQGLPGGGNGNRPDHGFNPDYPDQGLPGGRPGGRPSHPIELPEPLPPPPEEYADSFVYAVWSPTKQEWRVSVPDAQPKG